jgi:hypothetical protein
MIYKQTAKNVIVRFYPRQKSNNKSLRDVKKIHLYISKLKSRRWLE